MSAHVQAPPGVERSMQALLDLVESDRARLCDQILGEAHERARALRADAGAAARARMRQVFEEQRRRRDERLAAAEARLATERRLHEQRRLAAWLRLASEGLPNALQALWQQDETRSAWARAVLAAARLRLPPGRWRVVHAADWPADERERVLLSATLEEKTTCEADPGIAAGLKVVCGGIVLDGTLEGLLADRSDFESRLLQRREAAA
jgi:hypothetical protein